MKYNYIERVITIVLGYLHREYTRNLELSIIISDRSDNNNADNNNNESSSSASPSSMIIKPDELSLITQACIIDYFGPKMNSSDFNVIRVIGKGGYGEVRVAKFKNDGEIYAIKTLLKKKMIERKKSKNVRTERDLMVHIDHWLITRLFWSFQDSKYLYLVMEYCPGGDLMKILIKEDILSEYVTKFYMSECAVAINYLHDNNYVHRDIKPDNILIGKDGHIKLTDFGLSKQYATDIIYSTTNDMITQYQNTVRPVAGAENSAGVGANSAIAKPKDKSSSSNLNTVFDTRSRSESTPTSPRQFAMKMFKSHKKKVQKNRQLLFSAVGTPNYIAPEVFTKKGYGPACDYWSLGVITFECLVGYPPFYADTPIGTVRRIVNYNKTLRIPKEAGLSKSAKDFVFRLICAPRKRMSFRSIRKHSWLKEISFKHMKSMDPPFIPLMKSDADTRYFESVENAEHGLAMHQEPQYVPSRNSLKVNQTEFVGFSYERQKKPAKQSADSLFQ